MYVTITIKWKPPNSPSCFTDQKAKAQRSEVNLFRNAERKLPELGFSLALKMQAVTRWGEQLGAAWDFICFFSSIANVIF